MFKITPHQLRFLLASLVAIATILYGLVGCGDKNTDDYNKQKVLQEIAKLQTVVGTYRGPLVRKTGKAELGTLTIELEADTRITLGANQTNPSRQAVLKGALVIENDTKTLLSFSDGFLDSNSKELQATIPLVRRNSDAVTIQLFGMVSDNGMTGTIRAREFSEFSAEFTLTKIESQKINPMVTSDNPETQPQGPPAQLWTATYPSTKSTTGWRSVDLIIFPHQATNEEEFINIFVPVKLVDAAINFNDMVQVPFANSEWDLRTGKLHGETKGGSGADEHDLALDCIAFRIPDNQFGWNCRYMNNLRGSVFSASLAPKPSSK